MNEEENNNQEQMQEEMQKSKLKETTNRAVKEKVNEIKRQATNKIKQEIAKHVAKAIAFIAANPVVILTIVAIIAAAVLIIGIDDLFDTDISETISEVTEQSISEYCTIEETGIKFDKEKFMSTFPNKLKDELGIDLNDLGLGTTIIDSKGNVDPNSQSAQYLYRYMAAVLSSELPYIEGSDEETKGIIRIKRRRSDKQEAISKRGYIFVGESHVHKLEEALTKEKIHFENPDTYVSNAIYSKNNEYKYEYGTSGNGMGGNLFFIHTLYDGTEPECGTSINDTNIASQAFPQWLYEGDVEIDKDAIKTYKDTATAFERIKKIISNNKDIKDWNIVVMQGYSSALMGEESWNSYLNNLNNMQSELAKLGGNLYVSSTPHSNAGIWQQDTCYAYNHGGNGEVINNLQGPDSVDNAIYDQYNKYIQSKFKNFINVTSSSTSNSKGKDGNNYKRYEDKLDSSFCFDNYAHIDINHYDASTMYAWGEYIINVLDGDISYTPSTSENNGNSGNTNVEHKTIDTAKYGLSAEEVNITMDNIKNEYKIAWISDLHMMVPNQPTTDWYAKHGTTFEQRNNMFNNSYEILNKLVECINGNDFDAVVFGGDIMDNYSEQNFEHLKRKISTIGKDVMFLVADHDYLTEMTTNTGVNKNASSIGVSGDIKKITIGKNGDRINLVGQNYSNDKISDSNVNTIKNYLNDGTNNSLFFTHVPVESKTQAKEMQEWSKNVHNGQVYYWSENSNVDGYSNPSEKYLDTLYNSSSLRGVFAGHMHSSGDFELNTGIKQHIFNASFNNNIGVITITPSGNGNTDQGGNTNQDNIWQGNINKGDSNTDEIELKYKGYKEFTEMINSDDRKVKEDTLLYFSLDESWNLCITKWSKESKDGEETSYEISEEKIPYRNMVSGYTVPYAFLMDLQLISLNADYVEAVANLMTDQSYIDLTIFDTVTTSETTYTYEATEYTKEEHETTIQETEGNTIVDKQVTYYITTSEQIGPNVTVTKTETDTVRANITRAKTWIIDQTVKYNVQQNKEYPFGAKPGKVEEDTSQKEPSGEGTWRNPIKETWYEEIINNEWVKGTTQTKFMPNEFLGLWKNETGKYVKGAPYVTTYNNGKQVEYNVLGGNRTEAPIKNIQISKDQLYDLLEANQSTQIHSEIMKEIINFYETGKELTDDSFADFDFMGMFGSSEFNGFISFGSGTNTAKGFIHYFEGEPKESNGQYVVFDDGFGNLTVGWGIYIKSHIGRFSARGIDASSLKKGDLLDKTIVDSIEDEIIGEYRNHVLSATNRIRLKRISNRCTYK